MLIHLPDWRNSFLLRKSTSLYNRRHAKIVSTLTSYFTSCYVFYWATYFPDLPMKYPPSFDGRIVLYPTQNEVRDYFSWRQADTHVNNLYNTTFWALVNQGGQTTTEAHATLRGTVSKEKNEILFSRFQINYNDIDPRFRKGSVVVRVKVPSQDENEPSAVATLGDDLPIEEKKSKAEKKKRKDSKTKIEILHCDIIRDDFWIQRVEILNQ